MGIFTLFCDEDYHLDYTDLLLLLSTDPEPGQGLLKALSLVTQQLVDWPEYIGSPDPSLSQHASPTGAVEEHPTRSVLVTLDQLLRVISFNRMNTASLKLVKEELTTVFREVEGEDGTADLITLMMHPKGRDVLLHTTSYELIDYRALLADAAMQDTKFGDRITQPPV